MPRSRPEDAYRSAPPRRPARRAATALTAAALLVPLAAALPSATAAPAPADGPLQRAFADAATRYRVPQDVLLGVAYLESRWDDHGGAPSVSGGYGPLHLTDARAALARDGASVRPEAAGNPADGRGDAARPAGANVREVAAHRAATVIPSASRVPARLSTLTRAATLTGMSPRALRTDAAANVRGGAALLAAEQRRLGLPASADPAAWYAAVAHYTDPGGAQGETAFADDVFDVLRGGESRTTDSGQHVSLAAHPGLRPSAAQRSAAKGTSRGSAPAAAHASEAGAPAEDMPLECPHTVTCEAVPAPYQQFGDDDYGNHDKADRPHDEKIDTIVVHSTEGSWETTLKLIKDPTYVSWNYTIRSADGLIAQHVPTKDIAWHAGNWYVNSHSVGIEHEGFLAAPDAWFTESMYRASARLVRYLAKKYDIPLDRQHVLGHDNVPGTTASTVSGMHTDPGPYWDWAHYFALLGKPLRATAGRSGGLVTIRPDYASNQPAYTGCEKAGTACAAHGSSAVRLYSAPSQDAPLVLDAGLHPGGGASTTDVNDVGARATTGQQFAVAGRRGDWTAIWYLGQKAWFLNPRRHPAAVDARGLVVTAKPGSKGAPVYGRAYPEASAYPSNVPVQTVSPLPYTIAPGQAYAVGGEVGSDYLYAPTFDLAPHTVVHGKDVYYEIQAGARVGYVRAADVEVHRSGR